ncbi:MAG TPA: class I SAM-dependent methyltransferase [Acidimicrobiia bacterium]|nr:class I SAM-dependent methyltransferase [Acidimicrobiia bacterium]
MTPHSNVDAWDRAAPRYQKEYDPPVSSVPFGPAMPDDGELRILPPYAGKRVVDLGCGAGQAAVAFGLSGAARTIAVDASPEQIAAARRRAEKEGAKVDFRHHDLTELAFATADSIDLVFSAATLDYVEDLGRVLRAAHRVLKPGGHLVFTLEHPAALAGDGPRGYGDPGPLKVERFGEPFLVYPRTMSEMVATLAKAGFQIERLAEPVAPGARLPAAAVWRTRKEGR